MVASTNPALAADPWPYSTLISKVQADDVAKVAFSTDGTKVVAFDQEGRDHQVNIFPGGDAELVTELRKHQVQFAVVPPPEANPALSLLGGFGSLLINFLPLILLIGLNLLASRGGPGGMGGDPMGGAGVPFISASGSEFVEMFVGVGASRVRDLFGQAKKNAPCIIFIDEIDAVAKARSGSGGGGMGGGNDEREQTLNQTLTEMDGFDGNQGVIVLAATNRADVLDAALLRPGRFDRRVPVDLPDVKGRREILNVHVRGKPLDDALDLDIIAKRTTGFSGASLANLMNEAAIVAARNGKTAITYDEVDYAIDRVQVGMAKATGMSFPNRQKLVAYHEAGHAVIGLLSPDYDMVTKVTIIPRTNGAGGFTLFTPPEERLESGMYSKRYLKSQLAVALGGRCAEEIIYGKDEITTGASGDLQQVRNIARRMVAQWGFANSAMGQAPVAWETPEGNSLLQPRVSSEKTEAQID